MGAHSYLPSLGRLAMAMLNVTLLFESRGPATSVLVLCCWIGQGAVCVQYFDIMCVPVHVPLPVSVQALGDHGFPVPTAIDNNRHAVLMELVDAQPLVQVGGWVGGWR
jgi:hypothetical protein